MLVRDERWRVGALWVAAVVLSVSTTMTCSPLRLVVCVFIAFMFVFLLIRAKQQLASYLLMRAVKVPEEMGPDICEQDRWKASEGMAPFPAYPARFGEGLIVETTVIHISPRCQNCGKMLVCGDVGSSVDCSFCRFCWESVGGGGRMVTLTNLSLLQASVIVPRLVPYMVSCIWLIGEAMSRSIGYSIIGGLLHQNSVSFH